MKKNSHKGMTLVETLLYISILVIVVTVVVQVLFMILRLHSKISANRLLESSMGESMERIVREIRLASSVNEGASALNINPGTLSLDGVSGGVSYNVTFGEAGDRIYISKDGGAPGNLTSDKVTITNITFQKVTNSQSEGVRVTIEAEAQTPNGVETAQLYGFAVLRGSY